MEGPLSVKRGRGGILESQLLGLETLVRAPSSGDNWSVRDQRVMNSWVWNQIRLELVKINVQRAIESQTRSNRRNNLSDQAIQMLKRGSRNIEVTTADIIDSFVINEESTV
jgi:hypothetical protein